MKAIVSHCCTRPFTQTWWRRVARTLAMAVAAASPHAHAQIVETPIYNFTGASDGSNPSSYLLTDATGPGGTLRGLYGTGNGSYTNCYQCGNAFKLTPPKAGQTLWNESTLWAFTGGADGLAPTSAGLFTRAKRISSKTPLYGTTFAGAKGYGTVYSLAGQKLATIWKFTGGADGGAPLNGQVAIDKSGAVYAASAFGGGTSNCGAAIKLVPPAGGETKWTESTIWTFAGGDEVCNPNGLISDKEGHLFGTAGGDTKGYGGAFELIPPAQGQMAWTKETLWVSQGGTDGTFPSGQLVEDKNRNLFGETSGGGVNGLGTVFELTPPGPGQTVWTKKTLWSFTYAEGMLPSGALIIDKNGVLYGTATAGGGAADVGTVFKLMPPGKGSKAWTEMTLWTFSGGSDGGYPGFALSADQNGTLYGAATFGGTPASGCGGLGCGVIFALTGTGFAP